MRKSLVSVAVKCLGPEHNHNVIAIIWAQSMATFSICSQRLPWMNIIPWNNWKQVSMGLHYLYVWACAPCAQSFLLTTEYGGRRRCVNCVRDLLPTFARAHRSSIGMSISRNTADTHCMHSRKRNDTVWVGLGWQCGQRKWVCFLWLSMLCLGFSWSSLATYVQHWRATQLGCCLAVSLGKNAKRTTDQS